MLLFCFFLLFIRQVFADIGAGRGYNVGIYPGNACLKARAIATSQPTAKPVKLIRLKRVFSVPRGGVTYSQ